MPRRPRLCPAGFTQHIIQRGNNRQTCFASNKDIAAFANWLYLASIKYGVLIHAWVFMTNHIHLLATATQKQSISRMMQDVGRHYVRYFNFTHDRTGTLWEGRFKSCLVQNENYLLTCQRYIELNPVRANMVNDPADYLWSSYRANALGIEAKLRTPHQSYLDLGESEAERLKNYSDLFKTEVSQDLLTDIRQSVNTGLVLGTGQFKEKVAAMTGQRTSLLKTGPKAKSI